jgi:uncharacterized protein (TIGR00725 family)
MTLCLSPDGPLLTADGRVFDPWTWTWSAPGAADAGGAGAVSPAVALARIAQGRRRLLPVGVIGPRAATDRQAGLAEALGRDLAALGLPVLCGGKGGVMAAVARGVDAAGGLCLAFLPEDDWRAASEHVAMPLATGLGKARNVLIAQASVALIAVGGEYGTLTEIAFGLHFGKPVYALDAAPEVPGIERHDTPEAVCAALAARLLAPPGGGAAGLS